MGDKAYVIVAPERKWFFEACCGDAKLHDLFTP